MGLGCQDGFYQDGKQQSECIPSAPGTFCKGGVCKKCNEGHYCSGGGQVPDPGAASQNFNDKTGGLCPAENYCSLGSGDPRPCDAGS